MRLPAEQQLYSSNLIAAAQFHYSCITSYARMCLPAELYFDSPSAFSIYLKRLVNPARKADDGWKTVKYLGK
jgi:hypothetical protein